MPRRFFLKERRNVVDIMGVGEKRLIEIARYPTIVDTVGIGAIFGFTPRRRRNVIEQCGIDAVSAQIPRGMDPSRGASCS